MAENDLNGWLTLGLRLGLGLGLGSGLAFRVGVRASYIKSHKNYF
jgi:hypothetical protein